MDARKMKRQRGKLHTLTVRFPNELFAQIEKICAEQDITIASYFNLLLNGFEHKEIRNEILKVKESNYQVAILSEDMEKKIVALTDDLKSSAELIKNAGIYISLLISKTRRGKIPERCDLKFAKTEKRDLTLSQFAQILAKQVSDAKKSIEKCAEQKDSFFCDDLCYVICNSVERPIHRTKNSDEGNLYRTGIRVPIQDYEDIVEVCRKLSISIAEYFNILASDDGEEQMRLKLSRIKKSNYWLTVPEYLQDVINNLKNALSETARQLRIIQNNLVFFLRDIDTKKIKIDDNLVIAYVKDKPVFFRNYISRTDEIINGIYEDYITIVDVFLDYLFDDPEVQRKKHNRKIIDEYNFNFGESTLGEMMRKEKERREKVG